MRVAVLTGGGDAPGLNAAIRAVVRRSLQHGFSVVGVRRGWAGLLGESDTFPMDHQSVSGILPLGGTILGTSRTNPARSAEDLLTVLENLRRHSIDALVAIGGDDTLSVAQRLHREGVAVVGVPKTMDNDLDQTDSCIGFDTAVGTVVDALDKLHTTAAAHRRVIVVEVMGRDAGWVAVVGGVAGGADLIVIPERPRPIDDVIEHVRHRWAVGREFSLVVVAEGAVVEGVDTQEGDGRLDAFNHPRLDQRGIGERVARAIETTTGYETRVAVLGHLQRGGSPSVFDRFLATRLGVAAADFVRDRRFGQLPALVGNRIVPVPIADVVRRTRTVEPEIAELVDVFR